MCPLSNHSKEHTPFHTCVQPHATIMTSGLFCTAIATTAILIGFARVYRRHNQLRSGSTSTPGAAADSQVPTADQTTRMPSSETPPAASSTVGMNNGHILLEHMDVRQFKLHPAVQDVLQVMQNKLLEDGYAAFGRVDWSPAGERFNIVMPSTFGSDRRKPVANSFQQFCETIYWPLVNILLFGARGWESVEKHLISYKINTLRISEDEFYYNLPIYHFHLDHKIGKLEPRDENQQRTMRMIFSIVPGATCELDGDAVEVCKQSFNSTVYLRRQPLAGFHSNDQLHAYLQQRYPEHGLSRNRERPLYEVPDDELYRAQPGEICLHHSHPGRPIHAETNPCPEGRGLHVLDWADIRNVIYVEDAAPAVEQRAGCCGPDLSATGSQPVRGDGDMSRRAAPKKRPKKRRVHKVLPCTRIPEVEILDLMRVLAERESHAFLQRMVEVKDHAKSLRTAASHFPGGMQALEAVLERVTEEIRRLGRLR